MEMQVFGGIMIKPCKRTQSQRPNTGRELGKVAENKPEGTHKRQEKVKGGVGGIDTEISPLLVPPSTVAPLTSHVSKYMDLENISNIICFYLLNNSLLFSQSLFSIT